MQQERIPVRNIGVSEWNSRGEKKPEIYKTQQQNK